MIGDAQLIVAFWTVLTVPFILYGTYSWSKGDFGVRFVVVYWFLPVVFTVIGVIPPPWQLITG